MEAIAIVKRSMVFLFLVMFSAACAGHWFPSDFARPENRIAFGEAGAEHTGVWGTGDLSLSYRYILGKTDAGFTGEVAIGRRASEFSTLHHLIIRVHLLDGEGRILDSRVLLSSPYRIFQPDARFMFDRQLELPEGVVAFGFSYDGAAGDGGGGGGDGSDLKSGGVDWEFWALP